MRIAVLFGGVSEERDVSVASGAQIVRALETAGHEVVAIDTALGVLGPTELEHLQAARVGLAEPSPQELSRVRRDAASIVSRVPDLRQVDVVVIALHGGSGEDGTVQALLDLAGIPYTGTGHLGSAFAMDKDVSKRLFRAAGVLTPDWLIVPVEPEDVARRLGFPVVVKPNKQGSTVGLTIVREADDLGPAIDIAARYDDEVLVERFVPGRELTVGILEGAALTVGEIRPKRHEIFDYASKYQSGGADEFFPADLPNEITRRVQHAGLAAHHAVKAGAYSRVDFRLDDAGTPWCLEVNTVPGMTRTSLLPQSADAAGINFAELCDRICRAAVRDSRRKARKT
jgi:D-alanine-D-alanine ligase